MDSMKIKAIEHFASKPHDDPKSIRYFESIYKDIESVLNNSISFDSLSSNLDILEKFISFVAHRAINDLNNCWDRIQQTEKLEVSESLLAKYQTKHKLYSKIISLLNQLRYLEQKAVMVTLIKFWREEQTVRENVEKSFKDIAQFNLHAVERIGFTPQIKLLDFLKDLSLLEKIELFPVVSGVLESFLATDIEGHQWNYRTVTLQSMALPGGEQTNTIRNTTIEYLFEMYNKVELLSQKKELISLMNRACSYRSRAKLSDEAKSIINENTVQVLSFWDSLIKHEVLEIVQVIEHDSYWIYYRSSSKPVRAAALEIEKTLISHSEYQIYKDLVGFQGIFGSWELEKEIYSNFEKQSELRKERIDKHIKNLSLENLDEWLNRVELYFQTDSKDLATFPELFKFMEVVSSTFPQQTLSKFEQGSSLTKPAVAIFRGIWNSSIHKEFKQKINDWITSKSYLWEISTAFITLRNVGDEQITKLIESAITVDDPIIVGSILRIFENSEKQFESEFLNKCVKKIFTFLNDKTATSWINYVWFSRKEESFIEALSQENLSLIVDNLVFVNDVDHRVEGILEHVASLDIDAIFNFFEKRIEYAKAKGYDSKYEDIPFSLYSISNILSSSPEKLISLIKRNYRYDYGVYRYGVVSLFEKCFTPYESYLTDIIFKELDPKDKSELQVIIAIISCYEGHSSILPLVETLLTELDYNEESNRMISHALFQTGVTSGEYGHANALKQKLEDIKPWLSNENDNVVKFATLYSESLKKYIEQEIKRVDERVALEKHKYGVDDDSVE